MTTDAQPMSDTANTSRASGAKRHHEQLRQKLAQTIGANNAERPRCPLCSQSNWTLAPGLVSLDWYPMESLNDDFFPSEDTDYGMALAVLGCQTCGAVMLVGSRMHLQDEESVSAGEPDASA